MASGNRPNKFIVASLLVIGVVCWLAYTAAGDNKSYYKTVSELQTMGSNAYRLHLRVAGNVEPGSIHQSGPNATFTLLEQGKRLNVSYIGAEPPPDTFKDNAQALAIGTYGRDGVFHATQIQAKCASKYAPAPDAKPGAAPTMKPSGATATVMPPS